LIILMVRWVVEDLAGVDDGRGDGNVQTARSFEEVRSAGKVEKSLQGGAVARLAPASRGDEDCCHADHRDDNR
jgi:hypothetical protein